jgi:hypothetical protein
MQNLQLERLERMRRAFLFQNPINWTGYHAMNALIYALNYADQSVLDYHLDWLDLESQK